jgi:hypothetical protein
LRCTQHQAHDVITDAVDRIGICHEFSEILGNVPKFPKYLVNLGIFGENWEMLVKIGETWETWEHNLGDISALEKTVTELCRVILSRLRNITG